MVPLRGLIKFWSSLCTGSSHLSGSSVATRMTKVTDNISETSPSESSESFLIWIVIFLGSVYSNHKYQRRLCLWCHQPWWYFYPSRTSGLDKPVRLMIMKSKWLTVLPRSSLLSFLVSVVTCVSVVGKKIHKEPQTIKWNKMNISLGQISRESKLLVLECSELIFLCRYCDIKDWLYLSVCFCFEKSPHFLQILISH